jgi:hypothetical protein
MRWIGSAIIVLSCLYSVYVGIGRYGIVASLIGGLVAGFAIVGILYAILWLGRKFREKAPRAAQYTGTGVFWLGLAITIYSLGVAIFAAYEGAPRHLIAYIAMGAVAYGVVGWLIRTLLVRPISN